MHTGSNQMFTLLKNNAYLFELNFESRFNLIYIFTAVGYVGSMRERQTERERDDKLILQFPWF